MGGGVEEVFGEGDKVGVFHFLDEGVDGHGVDEFLVTNCFSIFERDDFVVGVDFLDGTVGAELSLFFGDGVGYGDPDAAGAAVSWEAEGSIGAPVAGRLLENNVFGDGLEIGSCNALTEPLALHLKADKWLIYSDLSDILPWLLGQPKP